MERANEHLSEVARLLEQIRAEYEAAVLGVKGLAYGTAQHQVINQKVVRMYLWQEELGELVGEDTASALVDQQLRDCPSVNSPSIQ